MNRPSSLLILAGVLSFCAAIFQAVIGFVPEWSAAFGAGALASNPPLLLALGLLVALLLVIFGLYGLSGAGVIRRLPLLCLGLLVIGLLYSLVGISFIFQVLVMLGILPSAGPIPIYRASTWYEHHGSLADAIHNALAAKDMERAAHLIEAAAPEAHMRSELGTLQSWYGALPEPFMRTHPTLCVFHAALLFRLRQFHAMEARLKLVADVEKAPSLMGIQMALRADLAQVAGDIARAFDCAREALALGEMAIAEKTGQDVRFPLAVTLFAAGSLEEIQANRGQLRDASATASRGLQLARETVLTPLWQHTLPQTYGGNATDYQFLEEADGQGIPRIFLLVSPERGDIDHEKIKRMVYEALTSGEYSHIISTSYWDQADTLRIKRMNPIPTMRGKIIPLHIRRK